MANQIHLYKGTVTAGGTDGTLVSEDTELSPITVGPLNATINEESAAQKLAVRCDPGYLTRSGFNTTITPTGTFAAKWALAPDSSGSAGTFGAYGAVLTISSVINATNTLFWVKAKAESTETVPVNDTTVNLVVAATVAAA
jgi:hypothetical protein